jgi:fatty-acyl-CoA synthase
MLVTEMIRRGALYHRKRTALLFGDERLSFGDVESLANRLANALIDGVGLQPLERVGVLIDNQLLTAPLDLACALARLTRIPLNPRLSVAEQEAMLEGAGVRWLIHGSGQAERAAALAASVPDLACICVEGGSGLLSLCGARGDRPPDRVPEPDDLILALYTSGTTGRLKAVQHSQSSYAAVVSNILANLVDPKPGDIMLHAAPLLHASGTLLMPYWLRGGTAAVLPGFDPASYLAAIDRWQPTALTMVPTMIQMLVAQPGIEQFDMGSVETIIYGASPMPRPLLERALGLWGRRFVQFYGQTEAPLAIAVLGKMDHDLARPERLASCGRPAVECEIRLIDEQGSDVAPGEAGEIALRAPFAMKSYLGDEALNAATFLPGGWMRTRDIGRFDEDGFLYLVERTSDMIVTGGYNVYPREVEDVLCAHAAVIEAAVIGIPDEIWGEAVTAFVVLRGGEAEAEELIGFARGRIAGYKVPKSVRIVAEIPKSPVGKPLRRALRDPFWEGRERRI